MTRVKVCGVGRVEDALAAAEAGADFIGLVFAESPRRLSTAQAEEIVRALGNPLRDTAMTPFHQAGAMSPAEWFRRAAQALEGLLEKKRPLTVGVFADMDSETVNSIADECGVDLIQLSGGESWHDCLLANRQVIKAVHVREGAAAAAVLAGLEAGSAIACLLDTQVAGARGGTGRRLDWEVAAKVAKELPIILAGGLTPDNVAEAVRTVRPWAVDVSSGVETAGVKDEGKIRAFIAAAKESV
jgi:phosphoribosylanthranilate isomerase